MTHHTHKVTDLRLGREARNPRADLQTLKRENREMRADAFMIREYPMSRRGWAVWSRAVEWPLRPFNRAVR